MYKSTGHRSTWHVFFPPLNLKVHQRREGRKLGNTQEYQTVKDFYVM